MDGTYIDEHFGSARFFQIYDITKEGHEFVETRKSSAYCRGHCEGGFDHILEKLSDCDGIFVSRIGQTAAAFMIANGKRVFEADGPVEELLLELRDSDLVSEPEVKE